VKIIPPKSRSQKLLSEVHLARIQLAKAEGQLATAKEIARVARRRRKEAKQAARRTKKQARLAKRELTDAKLALAKAEDKLARFNQPAKTTKSGKKSVKKAEVAPRPKQPVPRAASLATKPGATQKPSRKPTRRKVSLPRKGRVASSPVVVPRDLDSPVLTTSAGRDQTSDQSVEGFRAGSAPAVAADPSVEPDSLDDQPG